jgi:hypothetical protein
MAHLKNSILINVPVEKLNGVVGDPHNWATFITGMSELEKISGNGGVGTVAEHGMALMWGIRRPATTKVTEERHDPDGSTFWRWEQEGTAPAWWTCHHQPRQEGTLATSELEYTMPWGMLGKACDHLFGCENPKAGHAPNHGEREGARAEVLAGAAGSVRANVESYSGGPSRPLFLCAIPAPIS